MLDGEAFFYFLWNFIQGLLQVFPEVFEIFAAYGEPDQFIQYSGLLSFLAGNGCVRHGCGMLDEGFYSSQGDGERDEPNVVHEGHSALKSVFDAEADHGAESVHLFFLPGGIGDGWEGPGTSPRPPWGGG